MENYIFFHRNGECRITKADPSAFYNIARVAEHISRQGMALYCSAVPSGTKYW